GLVAVEAGRLEDLLQLGAVRAGVVGSRHVPGEQLRRDLVDPYVRGLRGQDRGDRQLQRVAVVQLAVRVRVRLREHPRHFARAPLPGQIGFHETEPTTGV